MDGAKRGGVAVGQSLRHHPSPDSRRRSRVSVRQATQNQQTLLRNPAKGEQASSSPQAGPAKPQCVGHGPSVATRQPRGPGNAKGPSPLLPQGIPFGHCSPGLTGELAAASFASSLPADRQFGCLDRERLISTELAAFPTPAFAQGNRGPPKGPGKGRSRVCAPPCPKAGAEYAPGELSQGPRGRRSPGPALAPRPR
jgi:hypothetical protein